jgi:hypothetical protein
LARKKEQKKKGKGWLDGLLNWTGLDLAHCLDSSTSFSLENGPARPAPSTVSPAWEWKEEINGRRKKSILHP